MQISINTPALLFPAITLLMLAYTNRFLALATLIRNLHAKYKQNLEDKDHIKEQIKNLRKRLSLIKQMQASGISSFFCCVLCMLFFYAKQEVSTKALEIELKDMLED
jgi:hypothetical protein